MAVALTGPVMPLGGGAGAPPGLAVAGPSGAKAQAGSSAAPSFAALLRGALQGLVALQQQASGAAAQLAAGNTADLATAVIDAEKANLSLQLAVEVRNRAIAAYQQLMQMQV